MDVSTLNINYFNDAQCTLMYLYNKSVIRTCFSLNYLCLNKSSTCLLHFQKRRFKEHNSDVCDTDQKSLLWLGQVKVKRSVC